MSVVEAEGGAHGALDPQGLHQRLGAVVAGAHCNPELVEQYAGVVVVGVAEQERDYGTLARSGAEDAHSGDLHHLGGGIFEQFMLVGGDGVDPHPLQVVETGGEGGDIHKVGRAGLEFQRQLGVGGLLEAHMRDHLASTLIRRHHFKPFFLAVEHSHPCGAVHLVRGEGVEVAVERLHVDVHMGRGLGAVYQHRHTHRVGVAHHFGDGIDRAEHIRHMAHRHQARALGEEVAILVEIQRSVGAYPHHLDVDALAGAKQLPGHYVGVMLHDGEDDLVAILHEAAETRCHKVDRLGGAAGEDHLRGGAGVDPCAHLLAGGLQAGCSLLRHGEDAAVHVGLVVEIHIVYRLHHAAGCLRGGGVVEIHERTPVHLAVKHRIFAPERFYIVVHSAKKRSEVREQRSEVGETKSERAEGQQVAELQSRQPAVSPAKRRSTMWRRRSRRGSSEMRSITSAMKACMSMRRASASGMPRVRM